MSKFIKLIPIIFLAVLVTACNDTYKYFYFSGFFYDDQGDLVIGYEANMDNPNSITKFAKFNTDTNKWEASEVVKKVIADEEIITANGKTIIENRDGAVVFEQAIPSISDIESQTDILLSNPQFYYEYFKLGDDYRWDRKTIIINVGLNKEINRDGNFSKAHSFLAEYDEINSLWNIKHLKEIATERDSFWDISNVLNTKRYKLFVNSDISLCHTQVLDTYQNDIYNKLLKCLVKHDNGEVSLQKLYGEILPAQYADVLRGMDNDGRLSDRPAPSRVFFDEKQNMYVLYNDTEEAKGKYFYFEMYKPDQPTVAQHKQKIYW